MKKIISLSVTMCAVYICSLSAFGQSPTYLWAKTLIGNVESIQRATVVDASGNVYISGVFFGTVDFDPGPGDASITPSPYGCNIYIAKYDANGNYLWAKNIPIAATYGGNLITLDGSSNIYISGFFLGTNVDFDPGPGTAFLSSSGGSNDAYMAKYDANGNYLWAKQIGSTGDDRGNEILTDASGNVLLTGTFSLTVDFDPGAGVANLTSAGTTDIFLAKYNAAGVFQWVKQIGGTAGDDVRDIALDNSGNIFLTGNFNLTADFDPGPMAANLTSAGGTDVFITKYDVSGNYLWTRRFGGTVNDGGSALKADGAGNIFVTGIFSGTVDFDPGPGVVNMTASSSALFYGKYDVNGNLCWIKQLPVNYYSMDLALDATGNIFISGYYGGGYGSPIDMDPGAGIANLTVPTNLPPPTYNIIGMYDVAGNYLWAGVFGRQCYCSVMGYKSSLFIDPSGYLYYSGIFNGPWGTGTVDFDPGPGVANLVAPSSVDNVFFAKYAIPGTPLPVTLLSFSGENINNVNHLYWTTASEINNDFFTILKSFGGNNFEPIAKISGAGNSRQPLNYSFDDINPSKGINYYMLQQTDFNGESTMSRTIAINPLSDIGAQLIISPNPATDFIQLSFSDMEGNFEVEILNSIGETITREKNVYTIDVSDLPKGVYFLKLKLPHQIITEKFITK